MTCLIIVLTSHFCFSKTNTPPHGDTNTVKGSQADDLKQLPFTLIRQKSKRFKNTEETCISILGKYTLPLGIWQADDSFASHFDAITVRELSGSQNLWLIEWRLIGSTGGTKCFFVICQAEKPEAIMLKGDFYSLREWLEGGWGDRSSEENIYRIERDDKVLTLWTERRHLSHQTEPMPLHHKQSDEWGAWAAYPDEWATYTAEINTRVTRTFRIERDELVPMQTVLEYQVQKDNTIEEIYQGLELESAWLASTGEIPPAGEWIRFSIPNDFIDFEENNGSWAFRRWWGGWIWMKFIPVKKK